MAKQSRKSKVIDRETGESVKSPLSDVEMQFILENLNKKPEVLAEIMKRDASDITTYVNKVKASRSEDKKFDGIARHETRSAAVMTQVASELVDHNLRHHSNRVTEQDYVFKPRG